MTAEQSKPEEQPSQEGQQTGGKSKPATTALQRLIDAGVLRKDWATPPKKTSTPSQPKTRKTRQIQQVTPTEAKATADEPLTEVEESPLPEEPTLVVESATQHSGETSRQRATRPRQNAKQPFLPAEPTIQAKLQVFEIPAQRKGTALERLIASGDLDPSQVLPLSKRRKTTSGRTRTKTPKSPRAPKAPKEPRGPRTPQGPTHKTLRIIELLLANKSNKEIMGILGQEGMTTTAKAIDSLITRFKNDGGELPDRRIKNGESAEEVQAQQQTVARFYKTKQTEGLTLEEITQLVQTELGLTIDKRTVRYYVETYAKQHPEEKITDRDFQRASRNRTTDPRTSS